MYEVYEGDEREIGFNKNWMEIMSAVSSVQPVSTSQDRVSGERSVGRGGSAVNQAVGTVIAARGLGKSIDDRKILSGIDLDIARGDFVALLGANGAGKTTLLKVIAMLSPATEGVLELFGSAVGRDQREVRKRLGLIGHGMMLYRDLGIMENLIFFGKLYGVERPRERAEELLYKVGLHHRRLDAVSTLSRGMSQRASIARALMHDPEVLLADEPFAGLDAPSTSMLEKMLLELHQDGKTIVLVNHHIPQSLDLVDRAVVLRKGRIVINKRADELTASEVLKEVGAI